jgi:hypothetical protein
MSLFVTMPISFERNVPFSEMVEVSRYYKERDKIYPNALKDDQTEISIIPQRG